MALYSIHPDSCRLFSSGCLTADGELSRVDAAEKATRRAGSGPDLQSDYGFITRCRSLLDACHCGTVQRWYSDGDPQLSNCQFRTSKYRLGSVEMRQQTSRDPRDGWRLTVRHYGRVTPLREMPFFLPAL